MTTPEPPRRRPEHALLEETADDLYEQAPCGYLSTWPDGTVARVNQTLLDWTGHSRDDLLAGTRFQSLLSIGSRVYYETHCAPLLLMQGFVNGIALDLVCADGRVMPTLLNLKLRRDADGTPLFNRITVFDATDRRRYERELLLARRKAEQVARDKADLIAMLSHDIRNPLSALMGVVHVLALSDLPESQQRLVRVLRSSSESMLNLLNRVLELSQIESNSFTLAEQPFDLRAVLDEVMSTFEARAREKQLDLRCTMDERVPRELVGDPIAMRQILTNLVGNGVKFTEHGSVTVTASASAAASDAVTLTIEVADTGIGIAPDRVDRIFDAYTQASDETAIRYGGTGLGLAITQKLLALYGSCLSVASVPGEGSTFSFSLRLSVAGG